MGFKRSLFIILLCVLVYAPTRAAFVTTVKGNKALVDLDGDVAETGDEFFLVNPDTGKKTAIVRVKQVKGNKALVDILKGRAEANFTLQAKASSGARPMSAETDPSTSGDTAPIPGAGGRYLSNLKESYGVTGSFNMNSMSANVTFRDALGNTTKSNADMKGNGFGVGAFYDYPFGDSFAGRAFGAIEQFIVSGDAAAAACSGTKSCDAKINYLSVYGLGKWYFLPGQYRSWVGAGAGFLLALSKESTALNESQISTNQVFTLGGGVDVQLSRQNYVPISLEYNMFPDSSTVKANMIILKAGWAWNL